jgi:hypothetical protein
MTVTTGCRHESAEVVVAQCDPSRHPDPVEFTVIDAASMTHVRRA